MRPVIAVEQGLTPVRQALMREGYRVVELEEAELESADALVVSGMDQNLGNRQDILTGSPVISAQGLTAEEVVEALRKRLRKQ